MPQRQKRREKETGMSNIVETIWLLSKVALAFFLLYLFIPYKVIKFDKEKSDFDALDKIFICLVNANLVTIILVHLLVVTGIYETFSLLVGYIFVIIGYYWIMNRRKDKLAGEARISVTAKVLDTIESNSGILNTMKKLVIAAGKRISTFAKRIYTKFMANPFGAILVILVFAFGAFVRFSHSMLHTFYGASDPYVHLAWVKYLGDNELYKDGVYPLGYNALISAINKMSFIDPYVIIRFIGAMAGVLIVFSVFYIVRKNFKNAIIPALFSIAAYAVGTELPINTWRQMNALPQEYAIMFILPGIMFLLKYFEKKNKKFLYLAAEVLVLTLLIHTYAAVILVVGYLFICLVNLRSFFHVKFLAGFAGIMVAAAAVGFLPIGIALLSGGKLHQSSIDFIVQGGGTTWGNISISGILAYKEKSTALVVMLICAAVLTVLSIIGLFYKKEENRVRARAGLVFAIITFLLYLQYRAAEIGIPALMEASRTGTFLGLAAAVMFGLLIGMIGMLPVGKIIGNTIKIIACAVIFTFLFQISNFSLPVGVRYEYEEAAHSYMQIKENYPASNWTIVSPVEQFDEVMGYGYHTQLWQFVQDVEVTKPSKVVSTTSYVFWFVEKIPLNETKAVTEADAALAFPVVTSGKLDDYYTIAANRRIIEAKAYYWLENYMKTHNNMSIYLDTAYMRIYMIKQDGTNPVNMMK